jgi:hypothetical protein
MRYVRRHIRVFLRENKLPNRTIAELYFEQWCDQQGVEYRRISEARGRRPDYAIRMVGGWCVVEVKEIDPLPTDDALARELLQGQSPARWVEPGARLSGPIRKASRQLKKFSQRGFPTVVCFHDTTIGFHTEGFHVEQAMLGSELLVFDASGAQGIDDSFLGTKAGGGAAMTPRHNKSISAIAVLHQIGTAGLIVDLYHNPFARVEIPPDIAAPYIRAQHRFLVGGHDRNCTVLDLRASADWQRWLDDPDGECARETERVLAELRRRSS